MFYKIDPTRNRLLIDLSADKFMVGDQIWVRLKGDFQPTPNGTTATDTFQNTIFQTGSNSFFATVPATVKARDATLIATNRDTPLGDNTDPDNDYGVEVKLKPFTSGDDDFRFRGRDELPDVKGSLYKAGGGDDVVVMPNTPVQGFNTGKLFKAGGGDDRVVAGDLGLKVDFGGGDDTFVLDNATISWGNKENRDRDGTLIVKSGGTKYTISNAEILKDGDDRDPLVKWYFKIDTKQDGELKVIFFENGEKVAKAAGFYDEALPVSAGKYEASFRKDGAFGKRIELADVAGYNKVTIKAGSDGGTTETDFVTSKGFLATVFGQIKDAYGLAGEGLPWENGRFTPLVPVTVEVGKADQPFLKARNITTDDGSNRVVTPKFKLQDDGKVSGLDYKSVQVFFTIGGSAEKGEDWTFAESVKNYNGSNDFSKKIVRHGPDDDGDVVYSVMLERGSTSAEVPIRILRDQASEPNEKIRIEVVDIDLWKHKGSGPQLYTLSGGPKADSERDFDGPTGLEDRLLPDSDVVVTIMDDLIS